MAGLHRWGLFSVSLALAFVFAGLLAVYPAAAADSVYARTAQSGKKQWMDEYSGWNNDCSFLTINIDVIQPPKHGRTSARPEIKHIPAVAKRGSSGACAGKKMKALVVYYTSSPGYHGNDRFQVRMKLRGQSPAYFIYDIVVH